MREPFTIKIHCKRYVKAYLEIMCGTPADLRNLPDLLQDLRNCLVKKPGHRENVDVARWPDTVTVIIPPDYFYRHGWEMNRENELDFNRKVEKKVKYTMRQFIALNRALGLPTSTCVREFQEKFGFYEPIWSFESIKKDFDRNGRTANLKTLVQLRKEMNKILLDNLSELGTISRKFIKDYCNG